MSEELEAFNEQPEDKEEDMCKGTSDEIIARDIRICCDTWNTLMEEAIHRKLQVHISLKYEYMPKPEAVTDQDEEYSVSIIKIRNIKKYI